MQQQEHEEVPVQARQGNPSAWQTQYCPADLDSQPHAQVQAGAEAQGPSNMPFTKLPSIRMVHCSCKGLIATLSPLDAQQKLAELVVIDDSLSMQAGVDVLQHVPI